MPAYDSKGNGEIENAVGKVQGSFRSIKGGLESHYKKRINGSHNCVPWLIAHSASVINRYRIGKDGRTGFRRWKGREFKRRVAEFGECVMYLVEGTEGKDKFEDRWSSGVWYGIRDETGESIIGTKEEEGF